MVFFLHGDCDQERGGRGGGTGDVPRAAGKVLSPEQGGDYKDISCILIR